MPIREGENSNPVAVYDCNTSIYKIYAGTTLKWQIGTNFYMTFQTNDPNYVNFSITDNEVTTFTWDLGDGTIKTSTGSVTHTYTTAALKTVICTNDNASRVRSVSITGINVQGPVVFGVMRGSSVNSIYIQTSANPGLTMLDLSNLIYTSNQPPVRIYSSNCTALTSVVFPAYIKISILHIFSCTLSTILDLTTVLFQVANIQLYSNSALQTINIMNADNTVAYFMAYSCNLTGSLDLSNFRFVSDGTSNGATINVSVNPNLTNVLFNSNVNHLYSSINISSCNLTNTIDFSNIVNIYRLGITINNNVNLTNIIFNNAMVGDFVSLLAYSCKLTGDLDLTSIVNLYDAIFRTYNNTLLTNIIFNNSTTGHIKELYSTGCNLTGILDLSNLSFSNIDSANGAIILLYNNANLTNVLFSTTKYIRISEFVAYACKLTGILDLSMFVNYESVVNDGAIINCNGNNLLTNVIFPITYTGYLKDVVFNLCNLSVINLNLYNIYRFRLIANNNANLATINLYGTPSGTFNSYIANNCSLTNVDLTIFNNYLEATINVSNNSNLTNVIIANTSGALYSFNADYCNLSSMDFSNIVSFSITNSTSIDLDYNTNLTNIYFGTPIGKLNSVNCRNCNLTTLDFSTVVNLVSTRLDCQYNSGLTSVIFGTNTTRTFSYMQASYCNLIGTLDLTVFTAVISGYLVLSRNYNLSNVIFNSTLTTNTMGAVTIDRTNVSVLDFSMLRFTGSGINLSYNPNLTTVYFSTFDNSSSSINISHSNLTGSLDLSYFKAATSSSEITVTTNPNLTNILLKSNISDTYGWRTISASYCNLTGTLDLSNLLKVASASTILNFSNNANLTSVIFPSSIIGSISYIYFNNCNLSSIDFSTISSNFTVYTAGVMSVNIAYNPNITSIYLGTTLLKVQEFDASYCNLTGTIDLSMIVSSNNTNYIKAINISYNPNLTGVIMPTIHYTYFYEINMKNCNIGYVNLSCISWNGVFAGTANRAFIYLQSNNMTAASINQILYELDSVTTTTSTSRAIYIYGNADPDSSSGGYDGITAKNNLTSKNVVVNTTSI